MSTNQNDTIYCGPDHGHRQTARGMLKERIERTQKKLEGLVALYGMLPESLDPKADEVLWHILCDSKLYV